MVPKNRVLVVLHTPISCLIYTASYIEGQSQEPFDSACPGSKPHFLDFVCSPTLDNHDILVYCYLYQYLSVLLPIADRS